MENGHAFFNGKQSAWVETENVRILQCDEGVKLSLTDAKSNKELDTVVVTSPASREKWFFDGLSCNEKGEKKESLFRNKAVLGVDLKVREAWAVNRKSRKWEKLRPADVACHHDEP